MSTRHPARYGPFHRRSSRSPDEIEKICLSSRILGKRRGDFFAGLVPAVKAWDGELPPDIVGVEFYTEVKPDKDGVPSWPEWSQGQPGVVVLERNELVSIDVTVTKRQDPE